MNCKVVIDTNVFMHADNPASGRQEDAVEFLESIEQGNGLVDVDIEGRILGEYRERISGSSLSSGLLATWLQNKKIQHIPSNATPDVRRWIGRSVGDALDRTFLKTAYSSTGKKLISHDYTDFPDRKRTKIKSRLRVDVLSARQFNQAS